MPVLERLKNERNSAPSYLPYASIGQKPRPVQPRLEPPEGRVYPFA